jgi:hypothetical protein
MLADTCANAPIPFTGCGDLEPEMQDTRTVILNMDFHGKSSSRSSSSVSASELSQYNTHLILALPSWENLTSSYKNFYSSFAQELMNTADNKVSLEIPLNTQMKIFAFLFKENYSMSELFSGTRTVGYYGESQSFSIGTQTNNLSLGFTLMQVPGAGIDTGGGTDNTAPTASVTAATITTSGNAVVQSTETGTAYLVNTTVSVSNNFTSITGAVDSQWNSVAISLANTDTNLPATGLADGTYKVYAVDAAANLSSASSNSVTVATTMSDSTSPTASVSSATITSSGNAVVQSTETGTAYLVNTTVSVNNNFTSITGAADSQWNSVAISLANTDTNLPATGLADGTYKVYAIDAAGNLSSASSNSVTVATTVTDTTAPTVSFSPANGATGVAISDNITITFSEAVRNIDNTVLTNSNSGDANGVGSLITLRLNNTYGTNIAFYATIDTNKTVITIDPTNNLPQSQAVYVAIGSTVEDAADNSITAANATFTTTMDPSLEAFYPFNGNANDLTSNVRNLAVYDNTTLITGKDNSSNSAYSFDSDGDYLEIETNIPSFNNYTISLWAKPASSGTYEAMFSSYDNSSNGFQIDLDGSNFHIRKSSGGNIVLNTAQLEVWTFIAFTYDGTNSIGYIDNETPVIDPGGTTEFNRFRIGRNRNGNTYFTGEIDELRIYNRALTASEISSLYAN